jgi:hypothetical protein
MRFKNRVTLLLILMTPIFCVKAQIVYEPTYHTVYTYLSRIAQRGVIQYDDVVLPLPRNYIVQKLEELTNLSIKLTPLERKELVFYLKEYKLERILSDANLVKDEKTYILKQTENDRFRFAAFQNKDFTINAQPIAGYSFESNGVETTSHYWNGARIYGYIGKNFGYSFDFRDNSESGLGVDKIKDFSPVTGVIAAGTERVGISYSELRAMMSYSWKWGSFSAGKDVLTWGYGEGGKLVLSEKVPSFPLIRLDIQPVKWLRLNYAHGWLNSNLVDSTKIFFTGVGTAPQISFRQKFLVTHSLIITPAKGLTLSIGESAIYNDEVKFVYLVPILFYRAIDHYLGGITATNSISNSQFFAQFSSRNHLIKNTHFYFNWFIDEFSFSGTVLPGDRVRNQTGYTTGLSITDFPIKNLFLLTEYTRIRPYTYINFVQAQSYQSNGYTLGHWIGSNADQWYSRLTYRIKRGLEVSAKAQLIRKGIVGTAIDQQNDIGTPFLNGGIVKSLSEYSFNLKYELIHDLFFNTGVTISKTETRNNTNTTIINANTIQASVNYGF